MARCPKCDHVLKPWNIKAECPSCGVNIPNYNWEERLNEDALRSDVEFAKFYTKISNLKSALFGGAFRIARAVLTFAPLVSLLFPIATAEMHLPYLSRETARLSILNIILNFGEWLDLKAIMKLSGGLLGKSFTYLLLALVLIAVAVVCGVLNFFMLIINGFSLKYKSNVVLCVISVFGFALSGVFLGAFFTEIASSGVPFITGGVSYAYYIGIGLFLLNAIMNLAVGLSLNTPQKAKV